MFYKGTLVTQTKNYAACIMLNPGCDTEPFIIIYQ